MTTYQVETEYKKLVQPSTDLISDIKSIQGDIMILGAGGKMGPSLALLAKQAIDASGMNKKVIAVARFSNKDAERELIENGVDVLKADLLNERELQSLPFVNNILYLAGTKFGTQGNESYTWAMNTYLPGRVAAKFKDSRIVVFSTGNVYPFTKFDSGGARESTSTQPIGEYAQSCLGRERMFQYFSSLHHTPLLIYRLNYAVDVTYGVLLEIGKSVKNQIPIDLSMGFVNVIWQADANEIAIRGLLHCNYPAKILNVTSDSIYSIRELAESFGNYFNILPIFKNKEEETALLSNASECVKLFGKQKVKLHTMIGIISEWILLNGYTLNKPTHFSERKGNF